MRVDQSAPLQSPEYRKNISGKGKKASQPKKAGTDRYVPSPESKRVDLSAFKQIKEYIQNLSDIRYDAVERAKQNIQNKSYDGLADQIADKLIGKSE